MAGIELPVSPLAHHYLITDAIPELAEHATELPMIVDLEGFTYSRKDQQGMLVGIYELTPKHWMMDGAPWTYGIELLQEEPDRLESELMHVFNRFPVLNDFGVKTCMHGAFTFSPDGNPLVGAHGTGRGIGAPAPSWRAFCKAVGLANRWPNR